MYHLTLKSANGKTGPIPVSTSGDETCADDCAMALECYAATGPLALHWRAVSDGRRGTDWPTFVDAVEDLPDENNRVTLDASLTDAHGIPAPKIHYALSDNSKKMLSHGLKQGRLAMRAAGAKKTSGFGPVRAAGWHLMGTAKMGLDPQQSVVDARGRSHDVPNLFVVDSSIFVTSGGVNPTSTMQALALYIAAGMKQNMASILGA